MGPSSGANDPNGCQLTASGSRPASLAERDALRASPPASRTRTTPAATSQILGDVVAASWSRPITVSATSYTVLPATLCSPRSRPSSPSGLNRLRNDPGIAARPVPSGLGSSTTETRRPSA